MKGKRNPWYLFIFILVGALSGGLIGAFLSQFYFLSWLGFGQAFEHVLTLRPDFYVISFVFDLTVRLNIGSIIGMVTAIVVFLRN